MSIPTFATRAKQWSSPPVDDVGYLPSKDLLELTDKALRDLVEKMEARRYGGWRNFQGRWRRQLRMDETTKKDVLDYGCGVGVEALQYAKNGNYVSIADISGDNVKLAHRVLYLHGYKTVHEMVVKEEEPILPVKPGSFDVIHCSGVLHHIPDPIPVVRSMHEWLRDNGELRLMLYSDEAWRIATKTEPPDDDVFNYVEFDAFWQHWDAVGGYADYYTRHRLAARFNQWFRVESCAPITQHGEYIGAILRKK